MRLGIPVLLRQTEIDHVDLISSFTDTHQEVVRLDVSVDEVSRVDVFDSGDLSSRKKKLAWCVNGMDGEGKRLTS